MKRPREQTPMALVGRNHPALRTPARPVDLNDCDDERLLASRMIATLRAKGGMALAACQVGIPVSIIATNEGLALANMTWTPDPDETKETALEGCLSIPGRWYAVERYRHVWVSGEDLGDGRHVEFVQHDLPARMWQHEADHLAGRLLIDAWLPTGVAPAP